MAPSQGNYEFGISRVIKSLEPYDKKLGTDTWCGHKPHWQGDACISNG